MAALMICNTLSDPEGPTRDARGARADLAAGAQDACSRFPPAPRGHFGSRGFTLVEVLVAVLVISIGMLGVARLVLAAVKANDSAYFRTQAANLAYSILDEMRANRTYAMSAPGYTATGPVSNPGYQCVGTGNTCTAAEMAQYELYRWQQQLNSATGGALPRGTGTVSMQFPTGPGQLPIATITITWDDSLAQWAFGTPQNTTPTSATFTLEGVL